jgi:hypothetical protein
MHHLPTSPLAAVQVEPCDTAFNAPVLKAEHQQVRSLQTRVLTALRTGRSMSVPCCGLCTPVFEAEHQRVVPLCRQRCVCGSCMALWG